MHKAKLIPVVLAMIVLIVATVVVTRVSARKGGSPYSTRSR